MKKTKTEWNYICEKGLPNIITVIYEVAIILKEKDDELMTIITKLKKTKDGFKFNIPFFYSNYGAEPYAWKIKELPPEYKAPNKDVFILTTEK